MIRNSFLVFPSGKKQRFVDALRDRFAEKVHLFEMYVVESIVDQVMEHPMDTHRVKLPQNAHLPCVEDFVAAAREKRPPLCDGAAGLRTNQLLEDILK